LSVILFCLCDATVFPGFSTGRMEGGRITEWNDGAGDWGGSLHNINDGSNSTCAQTGPLKPGDECKTVALSAFLRNVVFQSIDPTAITIS
jgi:hypothetical protein